MGYTTDFSGTFELDRPLDDDTFTLLRGLNRTRRMKRQGLDEKYGIDGEFYFNADSDDYGQEHEPSIVDVNTPPSTQPGLWCQWTPTDERTEIEWDGGEKFYDYVEWIEYLIERILAPRGYIVNGTVNWYGEDRDDMGRIIVTDNDVTTQEAHIEYR